MSIRKAIQLVVALLAGSLYAYFAVSFFSVFYTSLFSFILLSILFSALFQLVAFFLVSEIVEIMRLKWRTEMAGLLVLLLAGGLVAATVGLCWQFPTLYNHRLLIMDGMDTLVFAGVTLLSAGMVTVWLVRLIRRGDVDRLRNTRVYGWIRINLAGILLASLFFVTYFTLAATINFPGFRTLDQYFDADISAWLARLQAVSSRDVVDEVRAVHPAVLLFLRPPVWFVSLFLKGDRLHAIFVVHALAAALCVFLMWKIVRRATSNTSYALMAASLLGASASHILLGSMLETYIYSALALLFFVSLLQNEPISLKSTVLAGLIVFGITVTNLVQTVILYFTKQPRLRVIFMYCILVVGIVFALNLVQAWIYPAARLMVPSNLQGEQRYQIDLASAPWRTTGRVSLMTRAVMLYGIVAPNPFILMEELGTNVPNFRTFKITIGEFHVAGYTGLADIVAKLWMLSLVAAFVLFILGWFGKNKPVFALGLLACIGFNFALHVFYGDDPLLYSPDWVYALVLFVMLSFSRFANRKWFQALFIVFLAAVMMINLNLVRQIMEVSAPFYGHYLGN
jgi:hypothetical protein